MYRFWTPYWYLLLPVGLMVLFFFIPVFQALVMSMMDYGHNLYTPNYVGLDNYATLLTLPTFHQAFWNTVILVLGLVPAMVVFPILMALLVNGQLRGMPLFRALIYIPVITSLVVVGIAWKWLYAEDGLINYFLSFIGMPKIGWLINPDVALLAVMIVVVWKGLAYYMMMYLAHLQGISADLYEAALVDGANRVQRHWYITLPQLTPTMGMVALISIIGSLKLFTEIYVMTRGGPLGATQTLVYFIYERAFENLDLGLACAAGFLLMLILLAVSMVQIRYLGQGDLMAKPQASRALQKGVDPVDFNRKDFQAS